MFPLSQVASNTNAQFLPFSLNFWQRLSWQILVNHTPSLSKTSVSNQYNTPLCGMVLHGNNVEEKGAVSRRTSPQTTPQVSSPHTLLRIMLDQPHYLPRPLWLLVKNILLLLLVLVVLLSKMKKNSTTQQQETMAWLELRNDFLDIEKYIWLWLRVAFTTSRYCWYCWNDFLHSWYFDKFSFAKNDHRQSSRTSLSITCQ